MGPTFVFNTAGEYVAFVAAGSLFTPDCAWLGVLRGDEVHNPQGELIGLLRADGRLARDRSVSIPVQRLAPRSPMCPMRPLPPKQRLLMPALQGAQEDVFLGLRRPLTALSPMSRLVQLGELDGCSLIAADGVFLGRLSRDAAAADSLANPHGRWGAPAGKESIFNPVGRYGSPESPLSPYHPDGAAPPRIERGGAVVAYLTIDPGVEARVDPNAVVSWLAMR